MINTTHMNIRKLKKRFQKAGATLCLAGFASISATVLTTSAHAEPFIGEVRAFGEGFCPRSWVPADGRLLAISSNTALFSIIGTTFGGDGRTTMAMPNLMGRIAQSPGRGPGLSTLSLGEQGGAPTRTLTTVTLPTHNHLVNATNSQGNKFGPGGDLLADPNTDDPNTEVKIYRDGSATPNRTMDPAMIHNTGGSQPIDVQSPYLALTWCIAQFGLYPSRS